MRRFIWAAAAGLLAGAGAAVALELSAPLEKFLKRECAGRARLQGDNDCPNVALDVWLSVEQATEFAIERRKEGVKPAALALCTELCKATREKNK